MQKLSARGVNILLAVSLTLVLGVGGLLLLGLGWERIEHASNALRERSARIEAWAFERKVFRDPGETARAARYARWAELLKRVEVVDDSADLLAHVAERLQAPSVRALEVHARGDETTGEDDTLRSTMQLEAPDGDETTSLVSVPLAVSFRASYGDALALLERIERRQLAARIDSLDIKREHPSVVVQLGLTWFTRAPQEGEG